MMLILSRKLQETLVINGNIRITVTNITRGQVKLGIEAPRDINVVRAELLEISHPNYREQQR